MKFPVRNQDTWYHVGDLSKMEKKNSYEGAGLSISQVPNSWRRIARLAGDTYKLEKKGAKFLEMVYVSIPVRKTIFSWAIEQGYLTEKAIWVNRYYDDEYEAVYEMEFASREELNEEISWDSLDKEEQEALLHPEKDEDGKFTDGIFEVKRFSATEKLLKLECWKGSCLSSQAEDFAIIRYADEVLNLDGVHWDEEHDVMRLSAPRGVIFQSQLHKWKHEKVVSL